MMHSKIAGIIEFPFSKKEYECWWLNENTLLFEFDHLTAEYHKENGRFEVFSNEINGRVRIYSDYSDRTTFPSRYAYGDLEINLIKMEIQDLIESGIFLEDDYEKE